MPRQSFMCNYGCSSHDYGADSAIDLLADDHITMGLSTFPQRRFNQTLPWHWRDEQYM